MTSRTRPLSVRNTIATLALSIIATTAAPAVAAASTSEANKPTTQVSTQAAVVDEAAEDFRFIFEEAATKKNGKYTLDKELLAQHFGQEKVHGIVTFVSLVNGESLAPADVEGLRPTQESVSPATEMITLMAADKSYGECMKDGVMQITGLAFLTGGMQELIEQKAWKELAWKIVKKAGKKALMGGVAGFVGSMAYYAVTCAF